MCTYCHEFHSWKTEKYVPKKRRFEATSGLPAGCVKVQKRDKSGDCFYMTMLTIAKDLQFGFPKEATNACPVPLNSKYKYSILMIARSHWL